MKPIQPFHPIVPMPLFPRRLGALLLLAGVLRAASAQAPATAPASPATTPAVSPAVITVDASKVIRPIPRTVFGTFLEPIARSTYGGFWAELLDNPGFEPNPWSPGGIARMIERRPELRNSSGMGLPLPWEPLYADQAIRYEPRAKDVAAGSEALLVMGLPGKETGVKQEIYIPVQRERRLKGSLYAKPVSNARQLEITVRRRNKPQEVLARTVIPLTKPGWTRYSFALLVPQGALQRLEPADFAISLRDQARALIDQVFLYPEDSINGLDRDMVAMLRDMKTSLIRFGGNFTSGYHWRDGIGPIDQRPTEINQSWGIPEYNYFGTDEFLNLCKQVGAQPQIALNLGSGAPQEAADWVRYVNAHWGDKKGGLLWELGNELWGTGWQIGYPTEEHIAARTRAFSDAVRKVDPRARLIATGGDPEWLNGWNARQLTLPVGSFQYLSTHFVDTTSEVRRPDAPRDFVAESAFALPIGLERLLRQAAAQIDASPHKGRVKLAFTEWLYSGPNWAPDWPNMGGAVCAAGMLNMFMRNSDIVPISDMTGIGHFHGMLKEREQVYGTPSYWAFRMFSNADATRLVNTRTTVDTYDVREGNGRVPNIPNVPYLDVVGALNGTGTTLTLFCVNRHLTQPITAELHTGAYTSGGTVRVLRADNLGDSNSAEQPEAVHPVEGHLESPGGVLAFTFPPASVAVISLKKP